MVFVRILDFKKIYIYLNYVLNVFQNSDFSDLLLQNILMSSKKIYHHVGSESDLRQRNVSHNVDDEIDETVEAIIARHNAMQERVAEDMLKLAQDLKHSSIVS